MSNCSNRQNKEQADTGRFENIGTPPIFHACLSPICDHSAYCNKFINLLINQTNEILTTMTFLFEIRYLFENKINVNLRKYFNTRNETHLFLMNEMKKYDCNTLYKRILLPSKIKRKIIVAGALERKKDVSNLLSENWFRVRQKKTKDRVLDFSSIGICLFT